MQFVLPLAVLVLTWLAVWRYFLSQGHSQVLGHIGGVVMGLVAATLSLFLATSRQKTQAWLPKQERVEEVSPSLEMKGATEQQLSEEEKVVRRADLHMGGALSEP